ncbi:MAG: hypothetical protein J1E39_10170, partial [Eubacterium sp.]|nr:hypothetical protein [Eubacterium sp.]
MFTYIDGKNRAEVTKKRLRVDICIRIYSYIGGNLSVERFPPYAPSKTFVLFLQIGLHPICKNKNKKVFGREYEGDPFTKGSPS